MNALHLFIIFIMQYCIEISERRETTVCSVGCSFAQPAGLASDSTDDSSGVWPSLERHILDGSVVFEIYNNWSTKGLIWNFEVIIGKKNKVAPCI